MRAGSHLETLIIYQFSSRKFTTENDLYQSYPSERVVILIETDLINYKCLRMRSCAAPRRPRARGQACFPRRLAGIHGSCIVESAAQVYTNLAQNAAARVPVAKCGCPIA